MRMIKELAERIYEELEGAEDYAQLAARYRGIMMPLLPCMQKSRPRK